MPAAIEALEPRRLLSAPIVHIEHAALGAAGAVAAVATVRPSPLDDDDPQPPTISAATISDTEIDVTVNCCDGYMSVSERAPNGQYGWGGGMNYYGDGYTLQFTGLTPGTAYCYQVTSWQSGLSASTSGATLQDLSDISIMPTGPTSVYLGWDVGAFVQVQRSSDGGETWTPLSVPDVPTYTFYDASVPDDATYEYQVRTENSDATAFGSWFTSSPITLPLAPPTLTSATAIASNAVQLTWTNTSMTAGNVAIERYDLDSSDPSDAYVIASVPVTPGSMSSYNDLSVTDGKDYQYFLVAMTDDGVVSAPSDQTLEADTPAGAVESLTPTESANGISFTWTAGAAASGSGQLVAVYRRLAGTTDWGSPIGQTTVGAGSGAGFPDSGLVENTDYQYSFVPLDGAGNPSGAATTFADVWTLPTPASNLSAAVDNTGAVSLTWSGIDDNVSLEVETSSDGSDFTAIDSLDPGTGSYPDTAEADGSTIYYRIDALSGDGVDFSTSNVFELTIPLTAPSNLVATPNGTGEIDLSWTNNSQSATGFTILREASNDVTGGFQKIGTVTDANTVEYADNDGDDSACVYWPVKYTYEVEATDDAGDVSTPSSSASAMPDRCTWIVLASEGDGLPGDTYAFANEGYYARPPEGTPDPITGWTIDWGDGSTPEQFPGDPATFAHVYTAFGSYIVNATATIDNGGVHTANCNPTVVSITGGYCAFEYGGLPSQVVSSGDPVDVTWDVADDDLAPGDVAKVEWGCGDFIGLQPAWLSSDRKTVTARLDYAPAGPYYPELVVYDANGYIVAGAGFYLYVWGVAIDTDSYGSGPLFAADAPVLMASADGKADLQTVTAYFPAPPDNASYNLMLTTTDATDDRVWLDDNGQPGKEVLGDGKSTYPFSSSDSCVSGSTATFLVGAVNGNTTAGVLAFTISGSPSTAPLGSPPEYTGAAENTASNVGFQFDAPTDANGDPILVNDNPNAPAPTDQEDNSGDSDDSSDPEPPTAQLTKVTVICPANYPGDLPIRVNVGASGVRLWSDADEDQLLDGTANESTMIEAGGAEPTTFYVEALTASEDGSNPITFKYTGPASYWNCGGSGVTPVSPVGVSLAFDGADPGDPDATVPIDDSSTTSPTYAAVDVNIPANLPSGTTVTLTLDSSVANDVSVYDSDPTSSSGANVLLGASAGGETTYTWTMGTNTPPPKVYVDSSVWFSQDASFLSLAVTTPAAASNSAAMATSKGAFSPNAAAAPPTTVSATQPGIGLSVITVHYWAPHLQPRPIPLSVGHVSITLADGTYISWWPQYQQMTAPVVATPAYGTEAALESPMPVRDFLFVGLDQAKIESWWNGFKATHPVWSYPYGPDCATVVEDALRAGGALVPPPPDHYTPIDLLPFLKKLGQDAKYVWWLTKH